MLVDAVNNLPSPEDRRGNRQWLMLPVTTRDHHSKKILDTALRLLHRRRRAFIKRNRLRIIGGILLLTCWITVLWLHRRVDTAIPGTAGAALQQGQGGNGSLRTLAHFTGPALVSGPSISAAAPPSLAAASATDTATLLTSV